LNALEQLREALGDGSDEERLGAVQLLEPSCESLPQADLFLWTLLTRLLRANRLLDAARLIWSQDLFDPRPLCVQRIWHAIETEPKVILLGAGSMGKTYSSIAWLLLDYLKDTGFTNSKIISSSAGHAKSNAFSTLHKMVSSSRIKPPVIELDGFVGLDSQNRHAGISRISIPAGATGKAALQGFHPHPRPTPDPVFGTTGRVRALVDEAELVPIGLWQGVSNMLVSMEGNDRIKVLACTNPQDILSPLASYAEPPCGWNRLRTDLDKEWLSREGWKVIRLDAADHENVTEKKLIFPGFVTWGGYESLRLKGGGNSREFWCFGRGLYPPEGAADAIVPLSFLDQIQGTMLFVGNVVPIGGVDLAHLGEDLAIFCAGRYGNASGWRDPQGKVHFFEKQKYVLQVDQFFELPKVRSLEMADCIIDLCDKLRIKPEWLAVDATGIGAGVADALISMWSAEIMELNWGENATETKVLEDSEHYAIELYQDLPTEMYFCLRSWIEHDYVRLSPSLDTTKLFRELTKRRYDLADRGPTGLGRVRLQPKKEFKAVHGWSPDRADSLVMCLHVARTRGPARARATKRSVSRKPAGQLGLIEQAKYVRWNAELDRT
jgi:hypothetical protein